MQNKSIFTQNIQWKGVEELEQAIITKQNQQLQHQKNCHYIEAQKCRNNVEQMKKDLQRLKLQQLQQHHRNEIADLYNIYVAEINGLNRSYSQKVQSYQQYSNKHQKQMIMRQQTEMNELIQDLNQQLPIKVKQSSQLLNLRKMEERMQKQKNYVQAHLVQNQISQLYEQQKMAWIQARNLKINTMVSQLQSKHDSELYNWRKRSKTTLDQEEKLHKIQQARIMQKYTNNLKDLKSQQQKQLISTKGQFKTRGGSQIFPIGVRSKIL